MKALADQYIAAGSVSNLKSLFEELSDAEGHRTIHFAVSRNHMDTVNWILDNDPECVRDVEWVLMGRLTKSITTAIRRWSTPVLATFTR